MLGTAQIKKWLNESFLDLSRFVRSFMSVRKKCFFFIFMCDFFSWDFYFSTFSESERINAFNMRNGIDPKKEEDQVIDQNEFILDGWKYNMIE